MKQIVFAALLFSLPVFLLGQASYQPVADRFMQYFNLEQSDSIFNMYSEVVKEKLPQDKNKTVMEGLHIQFGALQSLTVIKQDTGYALYKASFKDQTLTMVLALDKQNLIEGIRFIPYTPEKTNATKKSGEYNISVQTRTGAIHGTLLVPPRKMAMPVVLIIAGSGPTDRNGNQATGLHPNSYAQLADSLYNRGIATLRYDKRGIGESAGAMTSESDLAFDDGIQDAVSFIRLLKSDRRFTRVIVLGHSEGSLIGMVAVREATADKFISVAGAGERIDLVIEKQLAGQSSDMAAKARQLFDTLLLNKPVTDPGGELHSLFRPSIQPYMISWLKYDPAKEIGRLKIPVLIVQGTGDLQVSVKDAQELKRADPVAHIVLITQMNHVLKDAGASEEANRASYANPDLPLKAQLVTSISNFVFSGKKGE